MQNTKTLADIKIKSIDNGKIEFDEILGFTSDTQYTTIKYIINGKERTLSIESEAVEISYINQKNGGK